MIEQRFINLERDMKTRNDTKNLTKCNFVAKKDPFNGRILFSIAEKSPRDECKPSYYEELMDLCEEIQAYAFDLPESKMFWFVSKLTSFRDEVFFGNKLI